MPPLLFLRKKEAKKAHRADLWWALCPLMGDGYRVILSMQVLDTVVRKRGDALSLQFEVEGANLTGKSARAQFKVDPKQSAADFACLGAPDVTINVIDTQNATITLSKTSAFMEGIAAGKYHYDIEVYTNADDVQTIGEGMLELTQDVTRITP